MKYHVVGFLNGRSFSVALPMEDNVIDTKYILGELPQHDLNIDYKTWVTAMSIYRSFGNKIAFTNKIECIRCFRSITQMGLRDSKFIMEVCEEFNNKYGHFGIIGC